MPGINRGEGSMSDAGTEYVGNLEVSLGKGSIVIREKGGSVALVPIESWPEMGKAVARLLKRKAKLEEIEAAKKLAPQTEPTIRNS